MLGRSTAVLALAWLILMLTLASAAGAPAHVLSGVLAGNHVWLGGDRVSITLSGARVAGSAGLLVHNTGEAVVGGEASTSPGGMLRLGFYDVGTARVEGLRLSSPQGSGTLAVEAGPCRELLLQNISLAGAELVVHAQGCMRVVLRNVTVTGITGSILIEGAPLVEAEEVSAWTLRVGAASLQLSRSVIATLQVEALAGASISGSIIHMLLARGPTPGSSVPGPYVSIAGSTVGSAVLAGIGSLTVNSSNITGLSVLGNGYALINGSSLAAVRAYIPRLAITNSAVSGGVTAQSSSILVYNSTLTGSPPLIRAEAPGSIKIVLSRLTAIGNMRVGRGSGASTILLASTGGYSVDVFLSRLEAGHAPLVGSAIADQVNLTLAGSTALNVTSLVEARKARAEVLVLSSTVAQSPLAGLIGGQLTGGALISTGPGTARILASVIRLWSPVIAGSPSAGELRLVVARSRIVATPAIGQMLATMSMPRVNVSLQLPGVECWSGNDYSYLSEILQPPGIYGVHDPSPGRGPRPGYCRPSRTIHVVTIDRREGNLSLAPQASAIYMLVYPATGFARAALGGRTLQLEKLDSPQWTSAYRAPLPSRGMAEYMENATVTAGGVSRTIRVLAPTSAPAALIMARGEGAPLGRPLAAVWAQPGTVIPVVSPGLHVCTAQLGPHEWPTSWGNCTDSGTPALSPPASAGDWSGLIVVVWGGHVEPRFAVVLSPAPQSSLAPASEPPGEGQGGGPELALGAAMLAGVMLGLTAWAVRQG